MLNIPHISNFPLSVPAELTLRETLYSYEVGVILFASFLLIAFARLSRANIYVAMGVGLFKVSGLRTHIRETLPLNKRGSILLMVNYVLATSLMTYLCLEKLDLEKIDQLAIAAIAPIAIFGGNIASLRITGWITKEYDVLKESVIMKILGAQALGLLYFLCALIWVLNASYQDTIILVVIWAFIIESAFRVIKSMAMVYTHGVSWYYIILYFCTLEILPLFVVFYFVLQSLVD